MKVPRQGLIGPLVLTVVTGIVALLAQHPPPIVSDVLGDGVGDIARKVSGTVFWAAVAWCLLRLVDRLFWRAAAGREGSLPPRLLVQSARIVVLLAVVVVLVATVFDQRVDAILVSSGAVGIVLGLAMQPMIMDFFSGIALSAEGPFHVGEWIKVDGVAGQVVEINWRATRLLTLDETIMVVPNSQLARKMVLNHEQPDGHFRVVAPITLEYGVRIGEARRVLLAGITAAEGVLDRPGPDVVATGFGDSGVEYELRWFVGSYRDRAPVLDRVITNVSDVLWRAGLSVPYPKRDVYQAPMPPREVNRRTQKALLLARSDLFGGLLPEEIDRLAEGLTERRLRPGEAVVREGEAGDSLFVIVDGLLDVSVVKGGKDRLVRRLLPGQAFGERSLLTGEPRTATVRARGGATVYELGSHAVSEVLRARPAIAEELSEVIARHTAEVGDIEITRAPTGGDSGAGPSSAAALLSRIRGFFRLSA